MLPQILALFIVQEEKRIMQLIEGCKMQLAQMKKKYSEIITAKLAKQNTEAMDDRGHRLSSLQEVFGQL